MGGAVIGEEDLMDGVGIYDFIVERGDTISESPIFGVELMALVGLINFNGRDTNGRERGMKV